ncbi:hypothetical protein NM688_g8456 [Phlebia brevispora]|uniref:Uncharacterized protein n=1 Tax=Phlebia brevispora TaxID=194682 RepID=A0ACC1RRL2_9APHY|nr:hypothetical protein NM688_g8456 [Phlebia brevispora]
MTSFIIKAHAHRAAPDSWKPEPGCPFCRIIHGQAPAFKVYETEKVIAVLDILPLRPGHTLVIPKTHVARVSELPPDFAGAIGEAVSKVAHAITQAMDNTGLNVVCNQEYAQAVPHVHYHIIPAPKFTDSPTEDFKGDHVTLALSQKEMHKAEYESRDELDQELGKDIAQRIRARL